MLLTTPRPEGLHLARLPGPLAAWLVVLLGAWLVETTSAAPPEPVRLPPTEEQAAWPDELGFAPPPLLENTQGPPPLCEHSPLNRLPPPPSQPPCRWGLAHDAWGWERPWLRQPWNYQLPVSATELLRGDAPLVIDGVVRGYYLNDQRIEWTGQEATLGAEGVVWGLGKRTVGDMHFGWQAEVYLNQSFDDNLLQQHEDRRGFEPQFRREAFELSQLAVVVESGWLRATLGRFITPFGRTYVPIYANTRFDAPFLRSEVVLWRETGLLLEGTRGPWSVDAALVNGGSDLDTNSSKGFVGRVGYDADRLGVGFSAKVQDGISSENQKLVNNYFGCDFRCGYGRWLFSAEYAYDEHGFHRGPFPLDEINWGRSLYFRDLHDSDGGAITGHGYYLNLQYCGDYGTAVFNWGQYFPEQIGDWRHDGRVDRGFIKLVYRPTPFFEWYSLALVETELRGAYAENRDRKGAAVLTGFQYEF